MISKKIENYLKSIKIDEILQMDMNEVSSFLIDKIGIFKSEKDLKIFIVDYIVKALYDDNVDFPITYYKKNKEA